MSETKDFYEAKVRGERKVGKMVGRFCDPSYDDIKLLFDDGEAHWFRYVEVRPVEKNEEDRPKNDHSNCADYGSATHMQSSTGLCPSCNKP